jgi:glycosyltransferase involved in cell wall biosynthesis
VMSRLLGIPADRMSVVPLGINLAGYERRHSPDEVFRIGYFARIAPEKGLQALAEAYVRFRLKTAGTAVRLEAAGYLSHDNEQYLEGVRHMMRQAGLEDEFTYHGAVDRAGKAAFLRSIDVLSVPATYDEPKGVFLLEAMASGVPVVQPRRGAFTEVVEKTGGGVLVAPDNPDALADGLYQLWRDRALREKLGERAFRGVRAHYGISNSADIMLDVFNAVMQGDARRGERLARR